MIRMGSKFLSTLKKSATVAGDVLTTKGDLLSRTSSALARLGVGANDTVLTADSGEATGLKWATGGGATVTLVSDLLTSDESTTSTSYVDSGLSVTLPSITDGQYLMTATILHQNNTGGGGTVNNFESNIDTSIQTSDTIANINREQAVPLQGSGVADGRTLTIEKRTSAGTQELAGNSGNKRQGGMRVLAVG